MRASGYLKASALLIASLMCGCTHDSVRPDEKDMDASTFVAAVQLAIDSVKTDALWGATQGERKHWAAACKAGKERTERECRPMLEKAREICALKCDKGACTPVDAEVCTRFMRGGDQKAVCSAVAAGSKEEAWCSSAKRCGDETDKADEICKSAASIKVPELKNAVLTLAVEEKKDASGKISIIVVSIGGGRTQTTGNTIQLTLKPRVRDEKQQYGNVDPPLPPKRQPTEVEDKLSKALADLIRTSVDAVTREYNASGKPARPPLALSDLEIDYSLVIDSNGNVGLKKEWGTPISVELGVEKSVKRTNQLKILFGRDEK